MGRTIGAVAKFLHEFVTGFGVLGKAEAFLLGAGGEAKIRDGWSNNVKGGSVIVAGCEEREDFGDF